MTDISIDAHGEFRVGRILSTAWKIFTSNFLILVAVGAAIAIPNLLMEAGPGESKPGAAFLGFLSGFILNPIGEAVILYVAFQYLRGYPAPVGDALRKGLARFWPIVGVAVLSGLGIAFASLLLVVPGVILAVIWSVALPACVLEGLGPSASLGRSSRLTAGYRWPIFGIILLLGIANIVGVFIAAFILGMGFSDQGANIGAFLWIALWSGYSNSVLVVIYRDLRIAKEGVDLEHIASVFD
jgi:hypothetical protein